MKIVFDGTWKQDDVPKGRVGIAPDQPYIANVAKYLNKLKEKEQEKGPQKLTVTIESGKRKRTLDQNALIWALYTIMANEMNCGKKGPGMVKPMDLYLADLQEYAERVRVELPVEQKTHLKRIFHHFVIVEETEENIIAEGLISTSMMDTREAAQWCDMLFTRLAEIGVHLETSAELQKYWLDWRQGLNDHKIVLHDEVMTQAEYKARQPVCEATGEYLGEGGSLHHIKAVGMGGDRTKEPRRNYTSNWLHLSDRVHLEDAPNWKRFVEKYPHLSYKVKAALKRDYELPLGDDEVPMY